MDEQSSRGFSGWILPGLGVVLLSAKLSAFAWPHLSSAAASLRDRVEEFVVQPTDAAPAPSPAAEPETSQPRSAEVSSADEPERPACCHRRGQ